MKKSVQMAESSQNKFIFLIPYYNHPLKIKELLERLKPYNIDILIIDDGSDSKSKEALKNLGARIFSREVNGGKGAAIKDGFKIAKKEGYTHAFQIDADMQHDLSSIKLFLDSSIKNPHAIIASNPIYKNKNLRFYFRKITHFWVCVNTLSNSIKDSMCGFRIYPLDSIPYAKSDRMDFDIEILLLSYFRGIAIKWLDVDVSYNNHVSHFRMLRDNLLLFKLHFKYALLLPFNLLKRNKKEKLWYERGERAGDFWLNITIFLVLILPRFLLNIVIAFVTFIYYLNSKDERKNLREFYRNLDDFLGVKKRHNIYLNFYYFGSSICDKIAAWKGKITHKDLHIINYDFMLSELNTKKRGQILLMSHFGNIEVARALGDKFKNLRIITFVYQKNTEKFLNMIDKISKKKIDRIYVDEINIKSLLELRAILDSGGHIGIMGDRIALNNKKNIKMKFFDKDCYFPYGAFLIAGLLEAKMGMLWCEKISKKYHIMLEGISYDYNSRDSIVKLGSDKIESIKPLLQTYISSLEKRAINNPTQWFSFHNFWKEI